MIDKFTFIYRGSIKQILLYKKLFGPINHHQLPNEYTFFFLKDKNDYKSCVIYKAGCSCGSRYIGKTKRNSEIRWNEHNNPTESSEPSKNLRNNINHCFALAVILSVPKNAKTRKNLEASCIALKEA